jgi:hypothetical protein
MAILEIPLDNSVPSFSFFIPLDGSNFEFIFRWNGRIETWVFDIFDKTGAAVQTGNPLISSFPLLKQNVKTNRPPGILFAINFKDEGGSAGRFEIGGNVKLFYAEVGTDLGNGVIV